MKARQLVDLSFVTQRAAIWGYSGRDELIGDRSRLASACRASIAMSMRNRGATWQECGRAVGLHHATVMYLCGAGAHGQRRQRILSGEKGRVLR